MQGRQPKWPGASQRRAIALLVAGLGLFTPALAARAAERDQGSAPAQDSPSAAVEVVRAAGARPLPQSSEDGIWTISAEAEREARLSPALITDPGLNAYVREIQCKVAVGYCDDLRLGVFRRPALNATVMPNGYTEVWTGLLLRATNEAQVAFVLGHEFAHFRGNHSLRQFESMRARQGALLALNIVIGAMATFDADFINYSQYADILRTAAYWGNIAGLFAFSREFEREADSVGQALMVEAGYAPDQAAAIWETALALQQASDNLQTRRLDTRGGIFRTHPITGERMADLAAGAERLAGPAGASLTLGAERHRAAIRPFLSDWLRDEIRRRDYGAMLALVERLRLGGDEGVMDFYAGEAYRLRRAAGDDVTALTAYQRATGFPDAPAETWRELAMILFRNDDKPGAIAALQTYLERAPEAADAALMRRTLDRWQTPSS
ncbi:MAG: M48 family metalloprotease [Hyphomonadaceae bacterium]|nr:M48 family metalloprotease [Hyphomonadaceae bacterium]